MFNGRGNANHIVCPLHLVHGIAALVFAVLGVATLLGAGAALGF